MDEDGYQKIDNMAKRTKRVLDQGQYVKATDLWYLTEVVLEQEAHNIDFYNVQYDIAYRGPATLQERRASLSPRDSAYQLLVNYQSALPAVVKSLAAEDETPPLSLYQMMTTRVHPKLGLPGHVIFGNQSDFVFDTLAEDFMKPVVEMVEKVLNETSVKVNVYTGQLDLICSTPGTIAWINRMYWSGRKM